MPQKTSYEALEREVLELRVQNEKYELLTKNTTDLLSMSNESAEFVYVSSSYEKQLGYTEKDLLGLPIIEKVHPDDLAAVLEVIAERYESLDPEPVSMEYRMRAKSGEYFWFETRGQILFDANGVSTGAIFNSRNVTERKQAEEELKRSEEKYRTILESTAHSITITEMETGRYIEVNDGFCKISGYSREEALGTSVFDLELLATPEVRTGLMETLKRDGEVIGAAVQYRNKQGQLLDTVFSAKPLRYDGRDCLVAVVQDITALREAEKLQTKLLDQLQQAQKLEAVGTLAGGIAHDFNNLLMGIQGRASLMMSNMDFDHPHKEHIREIEEYVSSAADLTKQLLGFARGGKYEVKSIDFNQLVTSSSILFGRTKKEIRIHTRLEESLPSVEVDRRQIEQVLLNIYVNAWQAMPGGGDLYLETRCVALDDAYCTPHRVTPGRYVRLSITDNGIGMSDRIRHRIFEPFFTTKEKGRGTGLGLASAYGIIKNHGGFFTVYSEKGQGTTFNIFLPASAKEATQEMPLTGELRRGEGTVLLVDDEEIILDVGQALLQELGYTVIAAKSGAAAVNEVRRRGSEIDLVILDLIMPDMGGGKTFDRIREIMPDMVVLLSSGYSIAGKAEEIIRKGANGFIQKPFSLYELSEKVRSVLGD